MRKQLRSKIHTESVMCVNLESIYFDGRKDATIKQVEAAGLFHKEFVIEEHITLTEEPISYFIGHFTAITRSSVSIAAEILHLKSNKTT